MQLHNLKKPEHIKNRKRVGRGGKRGRYCGRGIKGQKARAGANIRPQIRDFIKRIPKLRGVKFKRVSEKPRIVNLKEIDSSYKKDETVSPRNLKDKELIDSAKKDVKILGDGTLLKPLIFKNVSFSNSARKKVKEAKGRID